MCHQFKYLCRIIIPREIKAYHGYSKEKKGGIEKELPRLVISFCPLLVNEKHIKRTGAHQ